MSQRATIFWLARLIRLVRPMPPTPTAAMAKKARREISFFLVMCISPVRHYCAVVEFLRRQVFRVHDTHELERTCQFSLAWLVPHMVGHFPFAIGLLSEDIQKYAFVRSAGGLTVLHGCPSYFIGAPDVGDLAITADACWCDDQFCDRSGWSIGRKPVIVQSLFSDARRVTMRWEQHAVLGEESAHAISVSLEPCFFVLAVHTLYF